MAFLPKKFGFFTGLISKNSSFFSRNIQLSPRILGNVVPFNLSDIGEGIREVAIKEWFVKEGDKVSQFDNICEVQSDKASVTITSRYDGIIKKIHHKIDDVAYVGKPLIDIEIEDENLVKEENLTPETPEKILVNEPVKENTSIPTTQDEYSLCIPSVRRLARQYKIDLKNIKGTGKNSRILKEDVLKYLQMKEKPENSDEEIKIKGFQKAMFQTMTTSLKIPHFVYTEEIQMTKLANLRENLNFELETTKLSFVPFFIKAISMALKKYPILNSSIDEENECIKLKKSHNIGVAMDTKTGLAVPVIQNVQNMNLIQIAENLQKLMVNGKSGNFTLDELKDGTFTFSNIGVIGGLHASPVILSPQVAIIAIGSMRKVPKFDENMEIKAENVINLSAAGDHRVIDGATMANFVNLVKKYIENPYLLMLN